MELAKRWRWLGVEFIVIALGVLSALFVDTWMEDRENAERAEEYRQRLISDIEQDVVNLGAVMAYFANIRGYGLLVLEDVEGRQSLDDFTLLFAAFNAAEEWGFELQSAIHENCTVEVLNEASLAGGGLDGVALSAGVQLMAESDSATGACGLDPAGFDVTDAAAEFRSDSSVENQLRFRNSEIRVAIALFDGQRAMAQKLLERLNRGL